MARRPVENSDQGSGPRVLQEEDARVGRARRHRRRTEREETAPSYMTRALRLTPLAPGLVDVIRHGRQGPEVTLARMPVPIKIESSEQRADI